MSKIILVGKSGSGKNTAMEYLKSAGHHEILSHTTRKRREDEGETYIFSDLKTFDKHRLQGKVFEYTIFGGYNYWTLHEDFSLDDWAIIVDPKGVHAIKKVFPEAHIIYVTAPDRVRESRVADIARLMRDGGKFTTFPCDYVVENDGLPDDLRDRLQKALKYFDPPI